MTPEQTTPTEIDIERESEYFALSLLAHEDKFTADSIKSLTEKYIRSLVQRVQKAEREKITKEKFDISIIPSSISYSKHDVKLMLNVNDGFFTISSEFNDEKIRDEVTISYMTYPDKCRFLNGVKKELILPMVEESFADLRSILASLRTGKEGGA